MNARLALVSLSCLAMFLLSCGVSGEDRKRVDAALKTFATEWNASNFTKIYESGDPGLRKLQSLEKWNTTNRLVRERRGLLQRIEVVGIDHAVRFVPGRVYWVDTEMHYSTGNTKGRFIYNLREGTPRLAVVVMEDAPQNEN